MRKALDILLGSIIGILILMNLYTYHKYQDALKNRAYIEVVGFNIGYNSAVLNSLDYMVKNGYINEDQYKDAFDAIQSESKYK